jgi:hypothetical protein
MRRLEAVVQAVDQHLDVRWMKHGPMVTGNIDDLKAAFDDSTPSKRAIGSTRLQ